MAFDSYCLENCISLPMYKADNQRLVTQCGCEYEYFGEMAVFCANDLQKRLRVRAIV